MGLAELDQVARVPTREMGYIYILTNPSMPGMRKIGYTSRSVYQRIKQLNSTGVPTPFRMERYFAVPEPLMREIEKQAHYKLGRSRVKKGREFFRASAQQSFDAVTEAIRSVTGTEPHDCVEIYRAKIATERAAEEKRLIDREAAESLRQAYIASETRALEMFHGPTRSRDAQIAVLQVVMFASGYWALINQSLWAFVAAIVTTLIWMFVSYGHKSYESMMLQIKRDAAAKYPFPEGSRPSYLRKVY